MLKKCFLISLLLCLWVLGATAADVIQLMKDVQKKVYDAYQVSLEPEVRLKAMK